MVGICRKTCCVSLLSRKRCRRTCSRSRPRAWLGSPDRAHHALSICVEKPRCARRFRARELQKCGCTRESVPAPPHTSGPKCTCRRNRLFVQNKKNDIFGICEIVKSIIIKISGDFNSTLNILKNPSCMPVCRNELRCQTPPLFRKSGSSCRCGVDWTRPKNAGLPKAFSRLSSPFRLSG